MSNALSPETKADVFIVVYHSDWSRSKFYLGEAPAIDEAKRASQAGNQQVAEYKGSLIAIAYPVESRVLHVPQ